MFGLLFNFIWTNIIFPTSVICLACSLIGIWTNIPSYCHFRELEQVCDEERRSKKEQNKKLDKWVEFTKWRIRCASTSMYFFFFKWWRLVSWCCIAAVTWFSFPVKVLNAQNMKCVRKLLHYLSFCKKLCGRVDAVLISLVLSSRFYRFKHNYTYVVSLEIFKILAPQKIFFACSKVHFISKDVYELYKSCLNTG